MSGAHVLLFEPDPATRLTVAGVLRDAGHVVVEAVEREAAIELIREGRFEMAVVAVGSPVADGLEVAACARRGTRGGAVVLLFLVEHEHVAAVRPILSSPLTDYITKPL